MLMLASNIYSCGGVDVLLIIILQKILLAGKPTAAAEYISQIILYQNKIIGSSIIKNLKTKTGNIKKRKKRCKNFIYIW